MLQKILYQIPVWYWQAAKKMLVGLAWRAIEQMGQVDSQSSLLKNMSILYEQD